MGENDWNSSTGSYIWGLGSDCWVGSLILSHFVSADTGISKMLLYSLDTLAGNSREYVCIFLHVTCSHR